MCVAMLIALNGFITLALKYQAWAFINNFNKNAALVLLNKLRAN